jgi:hypothetical protein
MRATTDSVDLADRPLRCHDCGDAFVFSITEQEFFADKGFGDPIRCMACRRRAVQRRREAAAASTAERTR